MSVSVPVVAVVGVAFVLLLLPLVLHGLLLLSLAPPRIAHDRQPSDVLQTAAYESDAVVPDAVVPDAVLSESTVPQAVVETAWLDGNNGKRLFAWLVLPASGDTGVPHPATVVMHGWGSNAAMMLDIAPPLVQSGNAVLFLDARCHGRSDGESFSSMPRFAEDVATALDYLRRDPRIDAQRLSLIGHSVGAGAVLLHAATYRDVCAIISLSAFAHPREVMQRWLAERHLPMAGVGNAILRHVQRVIGARFDDIAPINTIASVKCPVLLVHGTDDDTVPFNDARRLASAGRDVTLLAIAGGHDLRDTLGLHAGELVEFLRCHSRAAVET